MIARAVQHQPINDKYGQLSGAALLLIDKRANSVALRYPVDLDTGLMLSEN